MILCLSSKSPGTTISTDVIHFQVSWDRFPETYFGRRLLDENLRTQLLLLPAQLLAFAYIPMNHRRLTNVGFAANDPQTDFWQFAATRQRGPHVGIQQRLSLFRHTKDFQTGITIWPEFACFLLCAQVPFLPRLTQNIKSSNRLWSLQLFSFFWIFSRALLFRHWPHFIYGPQRRRLED